MSYCIEYGRQFIKSEEGITPCWLHGDNNVSDVYVCSSGRRVRRRARDWSVFQNMVGTTEAALLEEVEKWMGGPNQEHWKRNGKWVDDAALRRWVIAGCRNAATVEEILSVNPGIKSLRCYCSVWRGRDCIIENETNVEWTKELDQWIRVVRNRMSTNKDEECYPVIDFGTETVKASPKPLRDGTKSCLIKCEHGYLVDLFPGYGAKWSSYKNEAKVFSWIEAASIFRRDTYIRSLRKARIISAKDRLSQPFNAVLYFSDNTQVRKYISLRMRDRIYLSYTPVNALRYANAAAAEKAANELQLKYPSYGTLAVEIISEDKKGTESFRS